MSSRLAVRPTSIDRDNLLVKLREAKIKDGQPSSETGIDFLVPIDLDTFREAIQYPFMRNVTINGVDASERGSYSPRNFRHSFEYRGSRYYTERSVPFTVSISTDWMDW